MSIKSIISGEDIISEILKSENNNNENDIIFSTLNNEEEFLKSEIKESEKVDVVWVFALPEERDLAFEALVVSERNKTMLFRDYVPEYSFTYQKFFLDKVKAVAVTQTSMGMAAAASLVTRAVIAFKPKIVVMSGICAGRKSKVRIGDIIVADQTYDYTAGKAYVDKFAPRPQPIIADVLIKDYMVNSILGNYDMDQVIRERWSGWRPSEPINIYLKALASGTSVVDDSKTIDEVSNIQDNLYGIDMEAYGVALASTSLRTRWLIAKGVQDFADGKKADTEKDSRRFAAYASTIVTSNIIKEILPYIN